MVPPSAFGDKKLELPSPSPGSWFFVKHNLKEGKQDDFWKWMQTLDMGAFAEKAKAAGFANPCFCPTAQEGPFFCIWEANSDVSTEDFKAFIDDYISHSHIIPTKDMQSFTGTTKSTKRTRRNRALLSPR